jgi:hypothetical protein
MATLVVPIPATRPDWVADAEEAGRRICGEAPVDRTGTTVNPDVPFNSSVGT